jgi:hypothetical protein
MTVFPEFRKKHGNGTSCISASKEIIDTYQNKLPISLLEEWQEVGWCSYSSGLIWLVNPSDFCDVLEEWIDPSEQALVFARTAFGDLFLWRNNEVEFLSTQYAKMANLIDDIALLFEYSFCDNRFLDNVIDQKLFRKALKQHGPLEYDECYGFEPVLALGGSGEIDTVHKVKLREYLGILSQVVEA